MPKSIAHESARAHVTGRALYVEDLPPVEGELTVTFVGTPCARGRLREVLVDGALELAGVEAIYTHRDIPGANGFGVIFHDEPFLVADAVSYLGQPVAVIAARDRETAERARQRVAVTVEEEAPVLTIEEATKASDFLGVERWIRRGNLEAGWREASHRLEGVFESKGQEQFYLESQAALALPGEQGEIQIHSSTQNPTEIQAVVAEMLGLHQHQVVCLCKRMGGAFGGKETQAAIPALMVALVASRTGQAARIVYSKDDDMRVTGKRHPYRTDYKLGFDDDGRILAAELDFRSNGGAFADLSTAVLERTMLHADNAYYLPNVSIRGRICRTNLPPNTAFRGFGGPQAMAAIENSIEEIAIRLGKDALDVRTINLYSQDERSPRAVTPYGQIVRGNLVPELTERLTRESGYRQLREEVVRFNRESPTQLRGLALTPVKFGISFTNKMLNQANALVNVYQDGTVQVSTGATEMGQGVHTKIGQIVAEELGLEIEAVSVMTTSTEKNNNTSPTAASASTDLNGTAAVRACIVIRQRLADLAAAHLADPDRGLSPSPESMRFESSYVHDVRAPGVRLPFSELTNLARQERIDLGARGFYATPGIDFNRDTGRGNPFFYFTSGCAVAEVLIDRLTGRLTIERFEALLDIGKILNLGIDRGQVIGGIVQGIGWVTTEELCYTERGELLSTSPTTYKIPTVTDLPRIFKVDFFENDLNRRNLRSSKAVGEPPLMLGIAVWAAIKNALSYLSDGEIPELRLPATHEEILTRLEARVVALGRPSE